MSLAQTIEPSATEPSPPASPPPDSQPETPEDVDVPVVTEAAPGVVEPGFDDTGFNDSNTDVSVWWWVAGIVVAVVAVGGVVVAVRLRDTTERWAQRASLLCDSARAMSVTVSARLTDPSSWSVPTRYTEQHQRCVGYLTELTDSAPDGQSGALLAAVEADVRALHHAVTSIAIGSPPALSRDTVQPGLDRLSTSLTALEELATNLAMNAALPSSRSAN
jgi:hypothetical protein